MIKIKPKYLAVVITRDGGCGSKTHTWHYPSDIIKWVQRKIFFTFKVKKYQDA